MKTIKPQVEFECCSAEDLIDGLRTIKGNGGLGVTVHHPGTTGPDRLIQWSLNEIAQAAHQADDDERDKLCSNAVIHARRALGCLVDWYLERDLVTLCKDAPKRADNQAEYLVKRGILDELSAKVLKRAIEKRNELEHDYITLSLEAAEDTVDLIRKTIIGLTAYDAPYCAPWLYGSMLYSLRVGKQGNGADFMGWSGPTLFMQRFSRRPWIGLTIPTTSEAATIRRAFLSDMTTDNLLDITRIAEQRFGHPVSFDNPILIKLLSENMGIT